jgi:hypothetical protein
MHEGMQSGYKTILGHETAQVVREDVDRYKAVIACCQLPQNAETTGEAGGGKAFLETSNRIYLNRK